MSLRRLARESALYTVGNIAPKIGAFLLLPVYGRFLAPDAYGDVALMTSFAGVLALVTHVGIDSALMRLHFDTAGPARARLYFTVFGFTAATSILVTVLAAVLLGPRFESLFSGIKFLPLGTLALLLALSGSMQFIPSVFFRASGQAGRFLAVNLGAFLVSSVVSVTLVVGFGMGATGVLLGQLTANVGVVIVAVALIARIGSTRLDLPALRAALRLGLPLFPHALSAWALRLADRWLLAILLTVPAGDPRTTQIGIYAFGYQLGYVVTILITSFNAAWSPTFYRIGDRPDAPRFYADMTNVVLAGILAVAVLVSVTAPEVLAIIARPGFAPAADIVPIIAFASALQGAYTMFVTAVFFRKRTGPLALITFGSAALNIGLNVVLIPLLGIVGAALATFGAYTAFATATYLYARTIYPIRLGWVRLGALSLSAIAAVGLGRVLSPEPSVLGFLVHVAIALGFTALAAAVSLRPLDRLRQVARTLGTGEPAG